MTKPYIIRDTREKSSHGWHFDEDDLFAGTVTGTLKTGDYTIQGFEEKFVIERKASIGEWAGNLIQDRFEKELQRMMEFRHAFILLEFPLESLLRFPIGSGIPKDKWPKFDGSFLLRRTLEFQLMYGPMVWFCGNARDAEKVAYSIFKRVMSDKTYR